MKITTDGTVMFDLEPDEQFVHKFAANGYKYEMTVKRIIWMARFDSPTQSVVMPERVLIAGERRNLDGIISTAETSWDMKISRLPKRLRKVMPTGIRGVFAPGSGL